MSEKWLHREVVDLHGMDGRLYPLRMRVCVALVAAACWLCGFRRSGWTYGEKLRRAK